jgi:hypothetical protein
MSNHYDRDCNAERKEMGRWDEIIVSIQRGKCASGISSLPSNASLTTVQNCFENKTSVFTTYRYFVRLELIWLTDEAFQGVLLTTDKVL